MEINRAVGLLTGRLVLGFIFLMQGYGKVFSWGVENVYQQKFFLGTYKDLLPDFIIYSTAFYTSYIELIGGFLLVLGLKRNFSLFALASVLVIVTFGHGLATPIWDLNQVVFRTILLMTLLLLPEDWDRFSLDYLMKRNLKK